MDGQVFISYSRKDSDFADQLSRALSAKGLKTWMDVGAIQIGAMWREEIVHAIEGSSYFVVILSCHSIRSENVVKELSIAESADKVILPVLIDDVSLPAQMKYQLVGVQFIRFQSYSFEQGVESLLAGMQASAGRGSGKALLDSICADRDYQLQQVLSLSRNLSTFRVHNGKRKRTEVLKLIAGATTQEFRDEALRLDALRLQGVPRLHDHFQHESWYCLVQEDIQAVSWDTMTWTDQSLEDSVVKILAILSDVHAANIIHADIHPGNLLVDPGSSDVFLVGFGLPCTAVSPDDKYSDLSFVDVPGPAVPRAWADGDEKHYFNAPELARFDAINSAIDIYSLAVSVLVSRTGLAPSQLYDIGAGSWCLDALAPSLRSWLAPMLSESPEVRRSGVKAFLDQHAVPSAGDHGSPRILDGCIGHSASVLPGSDASPPTSPSSPDVPRTASASVWRRDDLLEQLRLKIGPIAQLFLEDAPEDLSSNDVRQLIDQLVGHGIDARQLDQIAHDAEITVETKIGRAHV